MIARASSKARKAGVAVTFQGALAQSLPYPDARFDLVLSTMMLHHLPGELKHLGLCEMRRVLKPGGRLFAVDMESGSGRRRGLIAHLHGHGRVKRREFSAEMSDAGFSIAESGPVGISNLQYAVGFAPAGSGD